MPHSNNSVLGIAVRFPCLTHRHPTEVKKDLSKTVAFFEEYAPQLANADLER